MVEQDEINIIKGTEHPEEFNPELREPPLLSPEKLDCLPDVTGYPPTFKDLTDFFRQSKRQVAQAQLDADKKWIKENKYSIDEIATEKFWQAWMEETSDFLGEGKGNAIPLKLRRVLPKLIAGQIGAKIRLAKEIKE